MVQSTPEIDKLEELAKKFDMIVHNQRNNFFGDYENQQLENLQTLQKSLYEMVVALRKNMAELGRDQVEVFARETIRFLTPVDKQNKEISYKDREAAYKNFLDSHAKQVAAKDFLHIAYIIMSVCAGILIPIFGAYFAFDMYDEAMRDNGAHDRSAHWNVTKAGRLFAKDYHNVKTKPDDDRQHFHSPGKKRKQDK